MNGYWNDDTSKLKLDNGNRDNRDSDNGPREKFLHKALLFGRALCFQIFDPAIRHL